MAFIDIKDPKERDRIVADYFSAIRNIQQRNEDEKALGLTRQADLPVSYTHLTLPTNREV